MRILSFILIASFLTSFVRLTPPKKIRIFLAGDSTMSIKDRRAFPETGWGMPFVHMWDSSVTIVNLAKNGRSTKSFRAEGLWQQILDAAQPGDHVIIQFGHNDESKDKGDRYSPPDSFKMNLSRFVAEARARQAVPILVTPVSRRKFDASGQALPTHAEYSPLVAEVARQENVLLIDLDEKSRALYQRFGPEPSKWLFLQLQPGEHPNHPDGKNDNTHFSELGARLIAQIMWRALVDAVPGSRVTHKSGRHQKINISQMRKAMNQWIVIPMLMTLLNTQLSFGQSYSRAWVPDNGDGTYKNPVLNADYSDPDAIRVGDDFYLVSSSFNHIPGLPILHSRDLVNWRLIGHALTVQPPEAHFSTVRHGGGVWAPSIRFHQGEFYIFYPDPDFGIYMVKARRPEGPWSAPHLVQAGKGLIDPCPFWDNDGRAWLAYAYAGSRAGIKSVILVRPMSPDATRFIGPPVMVFDGHELDPTIEGPKIYKRNGWYYIFAPGGGVSTGWQTILRSRNILGPYERKVALAQGKTNVNGPHQGAWVDTKSGEDWFLHFQDKGAYGRVVHLQPMRWNNDWPVIGEDADGDGTGSPVTMHRKPRVAVPVSIITPADSDEFDKPAIGLQWQWQANPQEGWAFPTPAGTLRLFSVYQPDSIRSLWNTPNILGQKTPADSFSAQVKLRFTPRHVGERIGLVLFGTAYADVSIVNKADGLVVECRENAKAEKGGIDKTLAATPVKGADFTLHLRMMPGGKYMLGYGLSDEAATWFDQVFTAQPGKWVGAKLGMYMMRNNITNDAGYVDVDYFRISK